jgi:hypothetical protein
MKPFLMWGGWAFALLSTAALVFLVLFGVQFDAGKWTQLFNWWVPMSWAKVVVVLGVLWMLDMTTKNQSGQMGTIQTIMFIGPTSSDLRVLSAAVFLVGVAWAVAFAIRAV